MAKRQSFPGPAGRVRRVLGGSLGPVLVTAVLSAGGGVGAARAEAQAVAAAGPDSPAVGPWETVRSDKGITVLRRTVSGSSLHEFQGTGVVEAPVATVLGILNDTQHRTEWMKESADQKEIVPGNAQEVLFYNRTSAPWPVADRDVVMRATTRVDLAERVLRIDFHSVEHPSCPPVKKVVRMPFLRGHWFLWPINGGRATRVEYQVYANPGGMLPDWIINLASKKIPHDTIRALQQQVKRRQYPEFEAKLLKNPDYQSLLVSVGATLPEWVTAGLPGPPAAPAAPAAPAPAAPATPAPATPAPAAPAPASASAAAPAPAAPAPAAPAPAAPAPAAPAPAAPAAPAPAHSPPAAPAPAHPEGT